MRKIRVAERISLEGFIQPGGPSEPVGEAFG